MFAFEFTILFISSIATAGKYILGLTEKYILRQEAKRRKLERAVEREQARQERLAAGESLADETPLDEEEEDEEWENELGGWEERAQWTFGLDLVTGATLYVMVKVLSNMSRSLEVAQLHRFLCCCSTVLRSSSSHSSRRLCHGPIIRIQDQRLHSIQASYGTNEPPISRRHRGRTRAGRRMHYLQRADQGSKPSANHRSGRSTPTRPTSCSKPEDKGKEAAMWSHFSFRLSPWMA